MSIDLDWTKLDASLASSLIALLNGQLQSTPRPSFIGPVEVTSFDFGSQPPDIELIDLRDIYRDFLEDDIDAEKDPARSTGRHHDDDDDDDDDDEFEWVSRRSAGRGMAEEAPIYHHLPPHIRYGRGPASDVFAPPPPLLGPSSLSAGSVWTAGTRTSLPSLGARPAHWAHHHHHHPPSPLSRSLLSLSGGGGGGGGSALAPSLAGTQQVPRDDSSSPSPPFGFGSARPAGAAPPSSSLSSAHPDFADIAGDHPPSPVGAPVAGAPTPAVDATLPSPPPMDEHPNLQLHLFISWHSDLRLTLTTSLRINYPSPLFMSLPIKLSVTGLVFSGELAVAYESGRRVHLCVLDDLDPYGPSARRASGSQGSTPSDPDVDDADAAKPLPVGQRLLPDIFIESELGQADKHVLKNVTRVEKFIQDVIRKTVEEELVFPNFHTLVLG